MPAETLIVRAAIRKRLNKLPLHVHQKIVTSLAILQENPLSGVKLHGELSGYYKYRIGDYRIIYRFNSKMSVVEIVKIEHRQGVYK